MQITSANKGQTITLDDGVTMELMGADNSTRVKFLSVSNGLNWIVATEGYFIRGWVPGEVSTEIITRTDGDMVELMFDTGTNSWFVVDRYEAPYASDPVWSYKGDYIHHILTTDTLVPALEARTFYLDQMSSQSPVVDSDTNPTGYFELTEEENDEFGNSTRCYFQPGHSGLYEVEFVLRVTLLGDAQHKHLQVQMLGEDEGSLHQFREISWTQYYGSGNSTFMTSLKFQAPLDRFDRYSIRILNIGDTDVELRSGSGMILRQVARSNLFD